MKIIIKTKEQTNGGGGVKIYTGYLCHYHFWIFLALAYTSHDDMPIYYRAILDARKIDKQNLHLAPFLLVPGSHAPSASPLPTFISFDPAYNVSSALTESSF